MSLKTNIPSYGANRRNYDQDSSYSPFEVIDVGDSKVAINEGVVIYGSSSIYCDDTLFSGSCKPQDLLGGDIQESKLLTVKKGDYVILILKNNGSSKPTAEIKAVGPADLDKDEYKRKENKIIKLALILDSKDYESAKYLDIKNLYASQVISETENWPAFTPVMWPVEKKVEDGETGDQQSTSTWKAVFVPGSVYLPQTMDECKFFSINNVSMLDLPVVEVKAGDKYYVTYEIDKDWKIKGEPKFTKTPGDKKIVKVVPDGPPCEDESNTTSDSPCSPKDGYFKLKILEFETKDGGLNAKMFWKSDICIYGWERCPADCDAEDGSGSDGSSDESNPPDSSSGDSSGGGGDPSDASSDDSSGGSDPAGCNLTVEVEVNCWGVVEDETGAYGGESCTLPSLRACFLGSDFSRDSGPLAYVYVTATAFTDGDPDCDECGTSMNRPMAYIRCQLGPYSSSQLFDLRGPGSTTTCAVMPGTPCGFIAATGSIVVSARVEDEKPECRSSEIADTATGSTQLPGLGTTGGVVEGEPVYLYCEPCSTTPETPGL